MSATQVASRRRPGGGSPLFLLVALAVAAGAAAPAGAQSILDDEAVAEYRLTDGALRKVIRATTDIGAVLKSDPALAKRIREEQRAREEREEKEEGEEKGATLAEFVALYDQYPPIRRAIAGAGLTSREYATFLLAAGLTGLALWAAEQDGTDSDLTPVQKANIAFYKRHRADFKRLDEEMKAREEKESKKPVPPSPPAP